jgi:hypothetical protein
MIKTTAVVCAAAFALAACSGIRGNLDAARAAGAGDPAQTIARFALGDLQAALADARAHDDAVAAPCWAALIPLVEQYAARRPDAGIAGGFSAFQRARDLVGAGNRGVPDALKLACAPVVLDTQATIARLGLIAGGAAATGGIGLPLLVP